ncbi:hypothetical protein MIND_00088700 [Mycena indigotica]|uniref:Uncharacterized protein n=1 Tax=Mycena indigotica TaxID=2126181 RepID=A0A8H6WKH2_9AGAR|nr:uncharacterized protein MIND_00088700 [Mycena indigotica]KAF7315729.1 hypothetical protein MIND_00088700 [Mycena indigotica]
MAAITSSLTNNKIMIVNLRATIIEITHSRESSLKKIVELETQMTTLRLSGSREQAFDHQLLIRAEETLTTVRLQADSLLGSSRTAVRAMNAAFSAVEIVEEDSTVPEEA